MVSILLVVCEGPPGGTEAHQGTQLLPLYFTPTKKVLLPHVFLCFYFIQFSIFHFFSLSLMEVGRAGQIF